MVVERFAAAVCAWLVTYLIHSTLLLLLAWLASRRMPSRLDQLAELVWRAAVCLPVLTSVAQHTLVRVERLPAGGVAAISYTPDPLTASAVPGAVWIAAAAIWLTGAMLALGQLGLLHWRLRREIRHRSPLPGGGELYLDDAAARESVRISVVTGLGVPFARTREICLPAWLVDRLPRHQLRAVVAHELAHVRRHDAFWRSAISAVARSFFFQPLNWMAASRLRELSECICDDLAVASTKSAIPLAGALEAVARTSRTRSRHASLAPAMGAPASLTLKRVQRMLATPVHSRRRPVTLGAARQVVVVAIAAAAAILLAPSVMVPSLTFQRYTISAQDPVGRFTVTVEKGRLIAATVAGHPLSSSQLRQNGPNLELAANREPPLVVQLTPQGGIRWKARRLLTPGM